MVQNVMHSRTTNERRVNGSPLDYCQTHTCRRCLCLEFRERSDFPVPLNADDTVSFVRGTLNVPDGGFVSVFYQIEAE